jgi:hypothetical protein
MTTLRITKFLDFVHCSAIYKSETGLVLSSGEGGSITILLRPLERGNHETWDYIRGRI